MSAQHFRGPIAAFACTPMLALLSVQAPAQDKDIGLMPLSVEEVIAMSLTNNIGLRIDEFAEEVQHYTHMGSWGAFDPVASIGTTFSDSEQPASTSLAGANVVESEDLQFNAGLLFPLETGGSVNVGYSQQHNATNSTFSIGDSIDSAGFSVTYSQPLMRGAWSGYATAEREKSELRWKQASARHLELTSNLRRDVTQAYWDLVAAQEALVVQEETVALGERQLEQNQRRLKVGVGTEVEVLQAETNVATQQEVLLQIQSNVIAADDAVKALIFARAEGDPWDVWFTWWDRPIEPTTPLPEIDDAVYVWTESLAQALVARPELLQRRIDIEISEYDLLKARSEERADLQLELTMSSNGVKTEASRAFESAAQYEHPTASASLNYSVPLRNRGAKAALAAARIGVRSARLAYEQAEIGVLTEVRAAVRDCQYQAEAVRAAMVSFSLATRQLEAEEARFAQGIATNFQVLEYQQQLSQAKSNLVGARVSYAKSRTALLRAEGRLDEAKTTTQTNE